MSTPLSIDPYNSRFDLDITLEINSDTYSYSNMIYYGFYGGTSVQAQELNELQESIQNQISLSNKLIGNWLEYNSNNVNKNIEHYNISSTLLTSVEDINGIGYIGRTVINGPGESLINGWYSYTDPKTGYNQYISLPAYEFNDFISDIDIRLVKSTDPNWNFLSDENSTTSLNINGADRFQRFLSVIGKGGEGGGIPVTVHSALPLQRFLDMDIYGFVIEKSQRQTSIDNTFPIIPYTTKTNSNDITTPFSAAGSIDELRTLTRDRWSGAEGLAGLAFQAGALGLFQDNTYHSQQNLDSSNYISISWTEDVTIVGTYGEIGDIVFQGDNLTDTTPEFQSSVGTISSISESHIHLRFNTYSDHINFYKNFKGPSKFIVLNDDGIPTGAETPIPIRLYFNDKNNYIILTDLVGFGLVSTSIDGSSIQEMVAKEGVFPKSGSKATTRDGYVFNYFDLGDSAKKIGSTQIIERSSINKYQWFDWTNNIVKGNNNNSIASGYHGNYIISNVAAQGVQYPKKINIPKGGYVQPLSPTVSPYDIFRVNPTFEEIQKENSNLIVDGKAKIRELYSGSLGPIGSQPEQTTPQFKHIDAITDDALITLDTEGVVTILVRIGGPETGTDLGNIAYFHKEILEKPGILTDENGTVNTSVPNKYVYACISSGFFATPGWVWLLKENGKVYGFEIKTATERSENLLRIKTENFDSPLGFSTLPLGMNINNIQGTPNPASWKTSTYIKYILNLIPKVNGQRLPVIDIAGGYGSAGQFTCAFPPEEGEENTITFADGKTHPVQNVQLIDIIKETEWNSTIKPGYDHLQRIKSTYDVATKSWSYPNNDIFDVDVYNKIFGVLNETDSESYNIPPRGWGVERLLHQSWILSNNGMLVVFNVSSGSTSGGIRTRGSLAMQETGNTYWGMCVPKQPTINTVTDSTDKIILNGTFTNGTLPRNGGPFRSYNDKPLTNIFNRPNIIINSTLGGVFIKNPFDSGDDFKIDLNNNSGHALLQFPDIILNTSDGISSKNVVVGCSVNGSIVNPLAYQPNYYKHIPHTWTLDEYSPGDQLKNTYKIIASGNNSTVIYNDFTWKIIGKPINGIIPNNIKDIMIIDYNVNPQESNGLYSVLVQNMDDTISMVVPPNTDMFERKVRNGITRPTITDLTNVTHMINHFDHGIISRVAIVTQNSNTWNVYLYSNSDLPNLPLVTTGPGIVKSITINEYHCSLIVLTTAGTTSVITFSFSDNNPGVPSNIPNTSGTEKYRKITSTAISTVLLKEDGTFLKWIQNEPGIDGILNKITQEGILVDDIYLGFWHSAIIKARDTSDNNYLIFHSSPDEGSSRKGRFRNIPVPLSVGRWNHNLGEIVANYKIIETVLNQNQTIKMKSINGANYDQLPDSDMKANMFFNKDTMFPIEPTYFAKLGACHPPLRRKTVFDLKNLILDPIFYPDDFSYDEWFGNTYAILDNVPGEDWNAYPHPSIELKFLSNWIDDSNIVEIIAFKDTDGNMPYTVINGQVSRNQAYSPYCSMTLTNLGNSEKTKNPIAWARSYGEGFCWIRQNGAICTHGVKFDEADHYAFAPMTWGTYPDIKNSGGVLYSDISSDPEIAQYKLEIEECKEIGKYIGQ